MLAERAARAVALAIGVSGVLLAGRTGAQEMAGPVATNVDPAAAWAALGPPEMKYRASQGIPAGYHLEERTRVGLIVPGAIMTAIGAIAVGAAVTDGASHGRMNDEDVILAAVGGGIFLGPGIPLLLVGILVPKKVLVRNDIGFFVSPLAGKHTGGASFGVRF